MSNRIDTLIELIPTDSLGIADVGTDHGYLPIQLIKSGYSGNVIATDINIDPLEKAISNSRSNGIEENRIEYLLSDGLSGLQNKMIDTIIIAGMGGDLICSILDKYDWILSHEYCLILQPMSKSEVLRYWLVNNGFEMLSDLQVTENGRVFPIIKSRFSGQNTSLSDFELYAGVYELSNDSYTYYTVLQHKYKIIKDIITSLEKAEINKHAELGYYKALANELSQIIDKVGCVNGSKG